MTLNAIVINSLLTKENERFQMSPFLSFTLKTDRFQNAPFSPLCVFIKLRFHSGARECKAKAERFYSVFI